MATWKVTLPGQSCEEVQEFEGRYHCTCCPDKRDQQYNLCPHVAELKGARDRQAVRPVPAIPAQPTASIIKLDPSVRVKRHFQFDEETP